MRTIRQINRSDVAVLLVSVIVLMSNLSAIGPSGRRRAREIVCQYNLRQWHEVFQDYLERNDGQFFTGEGGSAYYWISNLDAEHLDHRKTRIWLCPEADKPSLDENGEIRDRASVFVAWGLSAGSYYAPEGMAGSYGLNGYTVDSWGGTYEGGVRASEGWRDFDTVPHSDEVPLFVDALRFDLWPLETDGPAANEFASWSGNNMARCCINRHNAAVNCLFLDGSVRKVGLKELWTLKWHKSFNTAGPWTKAGGVTTADWPEWIRNFKDY
ncbi:H-X9-DG-CTERM domain-containing protein [Anaerobaca lacustris]|uniref:Uncharacterized protein n=1 Tax=Anaerobaca lacustris TaxID=3044600 RepID=A0AAW6TZ51_9BACT|nr:hypothetical protein [Sedimentisphaerales bacterium M17dextr]